MRHDRFSNSHTPQLSDCVKTGADGAKRATKPSAEDERQVMVNWKSTFYL